MALCGECQFYRAMQRMDEYWRSSHCTVRTINYYGSLNPKDPTYDTSPNARQAYLPVDDKNGKDCDQYQGVRG